MEVKVKKCHTVKPEEATWEGSLPLSELDQIGSISHIPALYFYGPPQNNRLTPPNTTISNILKQSLSRVLVPFYPLAGRLQSIGGGRFQLNCNSMGVLFIEAESDSELGVFGDSSAASSQEYGNLVPTLDYSTAPIHEQPLLLVQLTTFSCGIISLCFSLSHAVADGHAAFHFYSEWARFARNEPSGMVPFLDRKAALRAGDPPLSLSSSFHPNHQYSDITLIKDIGKKKTKSIGVILKLSKEQVEKLKHMANEGRNGNTITTTTTTTRAYTRYESLTGYIWRCTCKARAYQKDHPTALAVYVDSRSRMRPPLPQGYLGNAILDSIATGNAGDLVRKPLGYAASKVREAIERVTNDYVWSVIDYLKKQPDLKPFRDVDAPESVADLGYIHGKPDLFVVSWLAMPIHGLDFGWGREIYFDAETGEHFDGLSFIMPSPSGDGSLLVSLDLEVAHMETFKHHFYSDINDYNHKAI